MGRHWTTRWACAGALALGLFGCKESNPDFDGADSSNDSTAGTTQSDGGPGPDSGVATTPGSTSSVATSGTMTADTGVVPGSTGTPMGTTTGGMASSGGSTTGCEMCNTMSCVDLMTDNDHCGMCDNKCVGQNMCVMGECM